MYLCVFRIKYILLNDTILGGDFMRKWHYWCRNGTAYKTDIKIFYILIMECLNQVKKEYKTRMEHYSALGLDMFLQDELVWNETCNYILNKPLWRLVCFAGNILEPWLNKHVEEIM